MVVGGEAQLGVSRSKYIRLEVCKSLHIDNRMCFELSTFFGQPRLRRWISFHGLLLSEIEFRYHLPVVLRIHSPCQDMYLENNG